MGQTAPSSLEIVAKLYRIIRTLESVNLQYALILFKLWHNRKSSINLLPKYKFNNAILHYIVVEDNFNLKNLRLLLVSELRFSNINSPN